MQGYDFDLMVPLHVSIHMKPTPLPPEKAAWVETKMQEYVRAGIAKKFERCRCSCNVVLVDQGQSGQDYRLCSNFTKVNPHSVQPSYLMPDAR